MILVGSTAEAETVVVDDPGNVSYLTQTTLSVDETNEIIDILRRRFPEIQGPPKEDICYATQNRQDSVKEIARRSDVVLVIGSDNSSNSKRLAEVAREQGTPAYLVDDEREIDDEWLRDAEVIGLTSGASAPEWLVDRMVKAAEAHDVLRMKGFVEIEGKPMRLLVQGVGARIQHQFDKRWADGVPRQGRLVVIGETGLNKAAIQALIVG